MPARLFTVKGRVQGVWFRQSTRCFAEPLGLTGYAINLPNGDVEVLAVGDEQAIEKLHEWLHEGPTHARVAEVIATDAPIAAVPDAFTTG